MSAADQQQLADEIEEQNTNPNDPAVVRMRTWLEREWTEAGIDVRVCVSIPPFEAARLRGRAVTWKFRPSDH